MMTPQRFEVCECTKNNKISIPRERNIIFSSKKKNHLFYIKGCDIAKK